MRRARWSDAGKGNSAVRQANTGAPRPASAETPVAAHSGTTGGQPEALWKAEALRKRVTRNWEEGEILKSTEI